MFADYKRHLTLLFLYPRVCENALNTWFFYILGILTHFIAKREVPIIGHIGCYNLVTR